MVEQSSVPAAPLGTTCMPSYLVGQDREGRWLVVEEHGRGGGLFVSKQAALSYVKLETGRLPGSCHLASKPLGLSFDSPARVEPSRQAA